VKLVTILRAILAPKKIPVNALPSALHPPFSIHIFAKIQIFSRKKWKTHQGALHHGSALLGSAKKVYFPARNALHTHKPTLACDILLNIGPLLSERKLFCLFLASLAQGVS
jgi:hypothetical protein